MIASHYAEPIDRVIATATELRTAPEPDSEVIRMVAVGETFALLDDSVGWAWGYAGADRRVGYVQAEAVG